MNSNPKLSYAIAAILGGNAAGPVYAAPATDASSDAIQEITVTAQRRTENMQDVPITIQARACRPDVILSLRRLLFVEPAL